MNRHFRQPKPKLFRGFGIRVPIVDLQALRTLVRDALDQAFAGNVSAAATWVRLELEKLGIEGGLSQPTLQRVVSGKLPRSTVKESTFLGLVALVDPVIPGGHERLLDAILPPPGRQRLKEFDAFCDRSKLATTAARRLARGQILRSMRENAPRAFRSLERLIRAREHSKEAERLALDRVVEPFVLSADGGGIERAWGELGEPEKENYVKVALKREEILLKRDNDLRRAQRTQPEAGNRFLDALSEPSAARRRRLLRRRHSDAVIGTSPG